jgi:hypothetical protein
MTATTTATTAIIDRQWLLPATEAAIRLTDAIHISAEGRAYLARPF